MSENEVCIFTALSLEKIINAVDFFDCMSDEYYGCISEWTNGVIKLDDELNQQLFEILTSFYWLRSFCTNDIGEIGITNNNRTLKWNIEDKRIKYVSIAIGEEEVLRFENI